MAENKQDGKTRRDDVIKATWRVIVRDGLARTSMRSIAHELSCSTGVLTHHFRNKDDIVSVAINEAARTIGNRITRAVKMRKMGARPLEDMAKAILPIDPEGRQLWAVWIHFLSAALNNRKTMDSHARHYDQLRTALRLQFKELRTNQIINQSTDVDLEVDYIIALLDGLGVQAFISPQRYTPKALMKFISVHMARAIAANRQS